MKWITRATVLFAVLTLSAVAAWAQTAECTDEFKQTTYSKWYDNRIEHQDVAYAAAKEYVKVCPADDSPYATAVKKFIEKKDAADKTGKLGSDFKAAIDKRNYKDIVSIGNQYVAVDKDNSTAYLWIGVAGLSDASLLNDTVPAAKKAIELVEAGKSFEPYKSKELALAAMNELLGRSVLKTAPADAIPSLIKAAKYDSKNWQIYAELAQAYAGPRAKLTQNYQAATTNGTETDASKLILLNLNEVIDRQIDATARAAALATDATVKKTLMESLSDDYKFRKGSDAGLNEFVAGILAKPLPDPPTPITTLPASTSTPASTGGSPAGSPVGNPAGSSSTSNTAKPATGTSPPTSSSKPSTTGTTGGTPAKPMATPTPKPRSRRSNHRG